MVTKKIAIAIFATLLVVSGFGLYRLDSRTTENIVDNAGVQVSTSTSNASSSKVEAEDLSEGKIRADMFVGKLEEVNIGCFSDGECYVVVEGKHVTTLLGRSQEVVGGVQGVEGFGDLESHIGEKVQVYAQANTDGTYTLYGSPSFYVKLIGGVSKSGDGQDAIVGDPNPGALPVIGGGLKPRLVGEGCMIGGCSSQLCGEVEDMEGMVTTCEYADYYGCYQHATCEKQSSGKCGWTETSELNQCINSAKNVAPVEN